MILNGYRGDVMKEYGKANLKITKGKIIVNDGIIISKSEDIILVSIDLKSKYAKISSTGSDNDIPTISLEADEDTLYIDENSSYDTEIYFPDFAGYDIWACLLGRYTLNICFYKGD